MPEIAGFSALLAQALSGRKLELARQLVATATHKVSIRYMASVAVDKRLLFNGKILNIESVINKGENNFILECLCTEQVTGN